jgi:hypothetical protein
MAGFAACRVTHSPLRDAFECAIDLSVSVDFRVWRDSEVSECGSARPLAFPRSNRHSKPDIRPRGQSTLAEFGRLRFRLPIRAKSLCRHWSPIIFLPDEQRPGDPRRLIGDRNRDETGWFLLEHRIDPPGADRTLLTGIADHRRGSDDNERPQITVSHLRDPAKTVLSAG